MDCGTSWRPVVEEFPARPQPPLTIAVSECLLGAAVRYDGTGARSAYPHSALNGLFHYRGICPEVAIGLGTPRLPIRLEQTIGSVRAVAVSDPNMDVTERLRDFAGQQVKEFDDVSGYVFMKNSPSCGLGGVKVFRAAARSTSQGIYARTIVEQRPNLPVEENGRLYDPLLRESFVTRVFAYAHWQALVDLGLTQARLGEFHVRYKYLLMAHSVRHCQLAETLIGNPDGDLVTLSDGYLQLLVEGLSCPAGRGGHTHVLSHLGNRLKKRVARDDWRELERLISRYRRADESLEAPLSCLQHLVRKHPDLRIEWQAYLEPICHRVH